MASASESITFWVRRLRPGEREAAQRLWEAYFARLVGLARKKLRSAPRRQADEEDVALSAFASFCRAAEAGRFPRLEDPDDLWRLLVVIVSRKAANQVKHELRQKRGGGEIIRSLHAPAGEESEDGSLFGELISKEPDPALSAQMAEECARLLRALGSEELRRVAQAKLEGHTNGEIATALGRCVGTVERKLKLIRDVWDSESGHG